LAPRPIQLRSFSPDKLNQSKGIDATYHFTFTGLEARKVTITIRNQKLDVMDGHTGTASIGITADSQTWLGFISPDPIVFRGIRSTSAGTFSPSSERPWSSDRQLR
jgi:hypothetical protein